MPTRRKPYPSDVSDEEWSLVVPYLTLMREDAMQREHSLRELFNGLRYVVRYGIAWRDGGRSCQAARHCVGSRQIAGGQTGFRAAAQAVGGRTVVRMGDPMQETGQGL